MNSRKHVRVKILASILSLLVIGVLLALCLQPCGTLASTTPSTAQAKAAAPAPKATPKKVQIDLNRAVAVSLPANLAELKATAFGTPDGKRGWAIRIPGGRPIATPAYADGMIFVGGGYGSHEFYAFNADTGALVWKIQTGDDGPTAAVVEDGYVAFNTESCTIIVVDEKTGKIAWQEWLGDPLMSQPAIAKGRLYIAYPAGQRPQQHPTPGIAPARPGTHRLLAADLKTGRHIWEQEITGDVISAPVVSGERIHFTCFDGTSFGLDVADGRIVWRKMNAGTSAPVIADGQVVVTRKEQKGGKQYEGLARMDPARGQAKDEGLLAAGEAEYLGEGKGGGVGLHADALKALDSSVGFGTAPAPAKLSEANKNVGVTSVVGAWAYQGSRAAVSGGQMLNAQGRYVNSVRAADGQVTWRAEVSGSGLAAGAQAFAPPALGREYMYLSSPAGFLVAVRQQDGGVGFAYALKQPMIFQPALARGNVYVGTANGLVICVKTGSADADGWYAWGGNAQHNK
jgi:Ca-activated chloride channel family protein